MVCQEGQRVGTEGCLRFRWCGAVWGTMLGPEGFPPILSLPLLPLLFPVAPGGLGISSPGGLPRRPAAGHRQRETESVREITQQGLLPGRVPGH